VDRCVPVGSIYSQVSEVGTHTHRSLHHMFVSRFSPPAGLTVAATTGLVVFAQGLISFHLGGGGGIQVFLCCLNLPLFFSGPI
jgi:hypothetical protein